MSIKKYFLLNFRATRGNKVLSGAKVLISTKRNKVLSGAKVLILILALIVFAPSLASAESTSTEQNISTTQLLSQIQVLMQQIQALQQQVIILQQELGQQTASQAPATGATPAAEQETEISTLPEIARSLSRGSSGDDVRRLQEFLAKDKSIYPDGLITGYFGPMTESAVKRWQEKQGIESLGIFGPRSMARFREMKSMPAAPAIPATPATPAVPAQPGETPAIPATPAVPATPATPAQPATSSAPSTPELYPSSWPLPVNSTSTATSTSITVVQPNGGEYLQKGSTYVIVWNSLNVSNVFIRLQKRNEIYTGSGGFISGVMPNFGYYKWNIPASLSDGEEYKVEVVGGNYEAADTSDSFFSIMERVPVASTVQATVTLATTTAPVIPLPTIATSTTASSSITVLYPNGGEQLQKGVSQTITWNSMNVSNVYIKLRKGNDTYPGADGLITGMIPNTGYFQWFVPATLPDGIDYSIRVVDIGGYVYDDSDSQFSIVSAVAWVPTFIGPPVPTSTSTATTADATTTSSTTTASSTTETTTASSTVSSTTATTTPSITITSPNSVETWTAETTHTITWSSTGDINSVLLSLASESGSTLMSNIVSVIGNPGTAQWTVLSSVAGPNHYKISIHGCSAQSCTALNSVAMDFSDNYFTIVASTTATTTSTAWPGFYMSTDKQSYMKGETITLAIRRADGGTYPVSVELAIVETGKTAGDRITINPSLDVSSSASTTIQINTGTTEPFKSGPSGSYLLLICPIGLCGSDYTNSTYVNFTTAASDTMPPGEVTGLTATPESNRITLTWNNPSDTDFVGTKVLRRFDGYYPTNASDTEAWVMYNGSSTTLIDTSLVNGTTYKYKLFTYDSVPNYSSGATASAVPVALDVASPQISSVAASTTSNSATITWTTDESSNSFVEFGLTTSYGTQTAEDTSLVTSHSVNVSGLEAGTTYHYRVRSRDASNNLGNSDDYTFTTGQAIAMTIKGRMVNGLSREPVADSNMFFWNWKGSTQRQFYLNSDGTFSVSLTADDIANANSMYVNSVSLNGRACYDQSSFVIYKTTSNTINYISVNGPNGYQNTVGIANRTVQPTGAETDIGDLIVWPVTGFNLTSDIPVKFSGSFEGGSGGSGNSNYRTSHSFSTFYPLEVNTKITLTDQSGNQYNSSYVKYPLSQQCSPVTLNFSAGQFSRSPEGVISGSATTSSALTQEQINQMASVLESARQLLKQILQMFR